ncbi:MAG: hypothetical protein AB1Z98_37640 [Nannocystaceae bacterium]
MPDSAGSGSTTSTDVPATGGAGTTSTTETSVGTMGATSAVTMGMTSSVDTTEGLSATETGVTTDPGTTDGSSGDPPPPPECSLPSECDNNEDCDAGGNCVPACNPWGTGSYDYCLTDLGTFDTPTLCGAGNQCIFGGTPIAGTTCSVPGCADACDCPGPAATGDATVTCGDITTDGQPDCYLSCEGGETCPNGMFCYDGFVCLNTPPPLAMYGDCGSVDAPCLNGTCSTGIVGGVDVYSVCVTLCEGVGIGACDPAPPGGTVECDGVISPPAGADCQLTCNNSTDCPTGMNCIVFGGSDNTLCMWPPP